MAIFNSYVKLPEGIIHIRASHVALSKILHNPHVLPREGVLTVTASRRQNAQLLTSLWSP